MWQEWYVFVCYAGGGGTVYLMKKVDADRILTCFLENNITILSRVSYRVYNTAGKRSSYR